MPEYTEQAKILAAALYELRLLLGPGPQRPDGEPHTHAAALAYALHNQALAVLGGREFDVEDAWGQLDGLDNRLDAEVGRRMRGSIAEEAQAASTRTSHPNSIDLFSDAARVFCTVVESSSATTTDLAKAMAQLNVRVLDLPNLFSDEATPDEGPSRPAYAPPPVGISLPFDLYWDLFDPLQTLPDEPVANSLNDDIGDIYYDLQKGLVLYDQGFAVAACWEWRWTFYSHWGEHLAGAQRALYLGRRNGELFDAPE